MKMNIDQMAEYFSRISFDILNAYKIVRDPGQKSLNTYTECSSGIVFPLRGKAMMTFDGIPYEMEPGKIYHAGPKMKLNKKVMGDAKWEFILVHYEIPDSEKQLFPCSVSHYELETGYNPRINDLLQKLCHTVSIPGTLQTLRAKSVFFNVMDAVLSGASHLRKEGGRQVVEQAIEYINNSYMQPLTIPKLAEQYGLGSQQFAYLFQKYAKMSPNEYLISQRMSRARELLCTTTCSVSEISDYVGYSDPYYFSKLFKKRTGISPSALRVYTEKNKSIS